MKKTWLIICLLTIVLKLQAYDIFGTNQHSYSAQAYFFQPKNLKPGFVLHYNYKMGENRVYQELFFVANLSNLLNPLVSILFRFDTKVLEKINVHNKSFISHFLAIHTNCGLWNYSEYGVMEFNFYAHADLFATIFSRLRISAQGGPGIKIIALDINNLGIEYLEDYFAQVIVGWKISSTIRVNKFLELGLIASNLLFDEQVSLGAIFFEYESIVRPTHFFDIIITTGIGFVGVGSVAGHINHIYFSLGGVYYIHI